MHNYVFGTVSNNTQTEFNLANYGLTSYDINCCTLKVYGAGSIRYSITGDQSGSTMRNLKLKFDEPPPGRITITVSKVNKTDIVNSLPADLTVITSDGTNKANYNGALVYATDLEGKVTKINLTDKGTIYEKTTLFNSQSTSDNGRYIFTRPEATINNDNNLWLYFGTGNTQKLQEQSSQVQNRLYGIKDINFPNFVTVNPAGDVSKCKTAPNCPTGNDLGWYVNLEKSQKLTAEPTVDKDRVYFPIYEPSPANNKCGVGTAILRAYDSKCGNSLLNVNLGKGVLSKVVKQGDNLYIGLAGEADKNISGFTSTDNLITGKSQAKDIGGEAAIRKMERKLLN
jgi:type IV pilus assembly protein PilY1